MKKFTLGNSKENVFKLIPEKVIKRVIVGSITMGIVRIGESFFSFQAFCPHRGASLIQGRITGSGEIICPLHEFRFELKTGQVNEGSCGELEIFPTELTEFGLEISVPD